MWMRCCNVFSSRIGDSGEHNRRPCCAPAGNVSEMDITPPRLSEDLYEHA